MNGTAYSLKHLSDTQLIDSLAEKSRHTSKLTAELLAHLAEVDERQLYATLGFSSLFVFCQERLGFSEDEASKRIYAARTARRHPAVFELVASGQVTLTAVNLLAPHLDKANGSELLAAAIGKSKRQVEELVAAHYPQPDAPTRLRQLPQRGVQSASSSTGSPAAAVATLPLTTAASAGATACVAREMGPATSAAPAPSATAPTALASPPAAPRTAPAVVAPLSAQRYKLQVTLSRKAKEHLLRAQDLMRHQNPKGDLALVLERALEVLCERLEGQKFGKCTGTRRRKADAHAPEHVNASIDDTAAASTSSLSSAEVQGGSADTHPAEQRPRSVGAQEPPESAKGSAAEAALAAALAAAPQGGEGSRTIPRAVRRAVAERDQYRCAYVSPDGQRCSATAMLEYHHRTPFARGGQATVAGCELRCRAHNDLAARLDFGETHMAACKRKRNNQPGPSTLPPVNPPGT